MGHDCKDAQTRIISELLDVHETKIQVALIGKDIELINNKLEKQEAEIKDLKNSIPLLQDSVEEVLEQVRQGFSHKEKQKQDCGLNFKTKLFDITGKISLIILTVSILVATGIKHQDAANIVLKFLVPFLF